MMSSTLFAQSTFCYEHAMTFAARTLTLAFGCGLACPAQAPAAPQSRPKAQLASQVRVSPANVSRPVRASIRDWKEKDAPKCITLGALSGMMVNHKDSIDLVLRDGRVFRAKLKKGCAAIDYYSGLYIRTAPDGRLCEDRDELLSRTGGNCQIAKFKTLSPPK
jgi:hypothetical protein